MGLNARGKPTRMSTCPSLVLRKEQFLLVSSVVVECKEQIAMRRRKRREGGDRLPIAFQSVRDPAQSFKQSAQIVPCLSK